MEGAILVILLIIFYMKKPEKVFVELTLTRQDRIRLRSIAMKNNRTMVGQLRAMLEKEERELPVIKM